MRGKTEAEIFFTRGVAETLQTSEIHNLLRKGLQIFTDHSEVDLVVFDPEAEQQKIEDEGITARVPAKGLPRKVYVKLDDYGSPENLSESLGRPTNKRFVITVLLAEEW